MMLQRNIFNLLLAWVLRASGSGVKPPPRRTVVADESDLLPKLADAAAGLQQKAADATKDLRNSTASRSLKEDGDFIHEARVKKIVQNLDREAGGRNISMTQIEEEGDALPEISDELASSPGKAPVEEGVLEEGDSLSEGVTEEGDSVSEHQDSRAALGFDILKDEGVEEEGESLLEEGVTEEGDSVAEYVADGTKIPAITAPRAEEDEEEEEGDSVAAVAAYGVNGTKSPAISAPKAEKDEVEEEEGDAVPAHQDILETKPSGGNSSGSSISGIEAVEEEEGDGEVPLRSGNTANSSLLEIEEEGDAVQVLAKKTLAGFSDKNTTTISLQADDFFKNASTKAIAKEAVAALNTVLNTVGKSAPNSTASVPESEAAEEGKSLPVESSWNIPEEGKPLPEKVAEEVAEEGTSLAESATQSNLRAEQEIAEEGESLVEITFEDEIPKAAATMNAQEVVEEGEDLAEMQMTNDASKTTDAMDAQTKDVTQSNIPADQQVAEEGESSAELPAKDETKSTADVAKSKDDSLQADGALFEDGLYSTLLLQKDEIPEEEEPDDLPELSAVEHLESDAKSIPNRSAVNEADEEGDSLPPVVPLNTSSLLETQNGDADFLRSWLDQTKAAVAENDLKSKLAEEGLIGNTNSSLLETSSLAAANATSQAASLASAELSAELSESASATDILDHAEATYMATLDGKDSREMYAHLHVEASSHRYSPEELHRATVTFKVLQKANILILRVPTNYQIHGKAGAPDTVGGPDVKTEARELLNLKAEEDKQEMRVLDENAENNELRKAGGSKTADETQDAGDDKVSLLQIKEEERLTSNQRAKAVNGSLIEKIPQSQVAAMAAQYLETGKDWQKASKAKAESARKETVTQEAGSGEEADKTVEEKTDKTVEETANENPDIQDVPNNVRGGIDVSGGLEEFCMVNGGCHKWIDAHAGVDATDDQIKQECDKAGVAKEDCEAFCATQRDLKSNTDTFCPKLFEAFKKLGDPLNKPDDEPPQEDPARFSFDILVKGSNGAPYDSEGKIIAEEGLQDASADTFHKGLGDQVAWINPETDLKSCQLYATSEAADRLRATGGFNTDAEQYATPGENPEEGGDSLLQSDQKFRRSRAGRRALPEGTELWLVLSDTMKEKLVGRWYSFQVRLLLPDQSPPLIENAFQLSWTSIDAESKGYSTAEQLWADQHGTQGKNPGWFGTVIFSAWEILANWDCIYSEWSNWGHCSAACGGGKRQLTRKLLHLPPAGSDVKCIGPFVKYVDCNDFRCHFPCLFEQTKERSEKCSAQCGGGRRAIRRRFYGGDGCPNIDEFEVVDWEPCNMRPCKLQCKHVKSLSVLAPCDKWCGDGRVKGFYRVRHKDLTDETCGPKWEMIKCRYRECNHVTQFQVVDAVNPYELQREGQRGKIIILFRVPRPARGILVRAPEGYSFTEEGPANRRRRCRIRDHNLVPSYHGCGFRADNELQLDFAPRLMDDNIDVDRYYEFMIKIKNPKCEDVAPDPDGSGTGLWWNLPEGEGNQVKCDVNPQTNEWQLIYWDNDEALHSILSTPGYDLYPVEEPKEHVPSQKGFEWLKGSSEDSDDSQYNGREYGSWKHDYKQLSQADVSEGQVTDDEFGNGGERLKGIGKCGWDPLESLDPVKDCTVSGEDSDPLDYVTSEGLDPKQSKVPGWAQWLVGGGD